MTEAGYSATVQLKPGSPLPPPPRRRYLVWTCGALLALLVVLFLLGLVLALTVFKPRDPTTTLASASVAGVAPRVTLPSLRVEINVTLDIDVLVDNPNRAAFSHAPGQTELRYRGAQVGVGDVAPGRIPSRGSAHVYTRVTLEADRFVADMGSFAQDVLSGRLELDSSTRVPGRVTFLGFIKRHVVAVSDCHFVVGIPSLRIVEQQCQQQTKL
ncbi:hypothetical protein Taro_012262 [Colocasia esculenta]|uniref:Late embryogenesis abundant protein LEA-2 subgroup domain-containing protein n=1 Tax=Colocasia esculenta TaxID=4460 RepID=A0A843UIJ7_COLES|nr:hypothetical protein [Colocasia esculenta]